MSPLKLVWRGIKRTIKFRVLHANDSPHRIALGVALGVAIAWTPAIGLQTVMLIGLALLVRGNIWAGLPFLWLSNPLTVVPMYGPGYWLGCKLLGIAPSGDFVGEIAWAMRVTDGFFAKVQAWWRVTQPYAGPLWVGGLLMATVMGLVAYIVARRCVVLYRQRRPHLDLPVTGKAKQDE